MAHGFLKQIPNKREFLGRGMAGLGLIRALERSARLRGPSLLVLIYHRVAEPENDPYYGPVISATPENFRSQMRMIRDRYRVLRLDELPRDGSLGSLGGPAVLITFDDGYRDNAEVAAPILKDLGVPATFFLTTEFVAGTRLPWWDHVAYVVKHATVRRFTLDEGGHGPEGARAPLDIDLGDGSSPSRLTAIGAIVGAFLGGRLPDEARFLEQLGRLAGVDVDASRLGRDLFMTRDQARGLAESDGLFSIGSHTRSHRKLGALDEAEQQAELVGSKRELEAEVGREVDSLAYPYGGADAFDGRTERIAAEAGYRLAFSAIEMANRAGVPSPLRIGRLMIGTGDSAPLIRARLALMSAVGSSIV